MKIVQHGLYIHVNQSSEVSLKYSIMLVVGDIILRNAF